MDNMSCRDLIDQGIMQYNIGKLEDAYSKFEEAAKLCPADPNALMWKGKVDLMSGYYGRAINTLGQTDSAEGRLWLSLSLYLFSFLLEGPEREMALKEALHYALSASNGLMRGDEYVSGGAKLSEVARLVAVLVLAEQGRVGEAQGLITDLSSALRNLGEAYLSLRRNDYRSVDDKVYDAKFFLGEIGLNDRLIFRLLEDLAVLAKVRALLEEQKPGEALSELVKATTQALKPLVLFYMADAYEQMNNDVAACMAYSEVLKFVDSPLARSRLARCSHPGVRYPVPVPSRPLAKVVPINVDPNAFVGRRVGLYNVNRLIGTGGFGYVYEAELGGKRYAIKVLKLEKGDPLAYFKDLFNEANNLVNLSNHQDIVKLYAVYVDLNVITHVLGGDLSLYYADPPRIVMEFMEGGSLESYLEDDAFFYSSNWERTVIKAMKQAAEALDHIHREGYIHSDVKPQNIFLAKKPKDPSDLLNTEFKLGDLGSAVRAGNRLLQATPEYYPPEIFTDTAKPSMDVFALGITLYRLLTRKVRPDIQTMNVAFDCYINNDVNCVKQKVEESKRLLASWDPEVNEPYKSLIKKMTDPDLAKRPTADDVVKELSKF